MLAADIRTIPYVTSTALVCLRVPFVPLLAVNKQGCHLLAALPCAFERRGPAGRGEIQVPSA